MFTNEAPVLWTTEHFYLFFTLVNRLGSAAALRDIRQIVKKMSKREKRSNTGMEKRFLFMLSAVAEKLLSSFKKPR